LDNSSLSEEQRDYINTIHASTNNLVNVVKNLVVTTKAQSNEPENLTRFNLYTTLNNTLRLFSGKPGLSGTHFNLSLSAGIPSTLIGNSIKIKQIFLNLINSIIKNNEQANKFITIEVSRIDGMPGKVELLFRVVTNLIVQPVELNNEEDFYNSSDLDRINNSQLINQLDMGISLKIIEAEGKAFNILTEQDKTIFEFPLTFLEESTRDEQLKEKDETQKQQITSSEKPGIDLKNANILLAEDNISNQQIIILYIKNEVKKVDVAFNGKEVLEKFGHAKYDLILMDIQMPIMDGIKATQKIREIEQSTNAHTPVIAVTANAFPEDKERCMAAGMDGYISKPFQPEELLELMRNHLK
jgi:CheY-like chemotaxis protein